MTAISDRFETLKQNQECALIPFITAGDPDLETTAAALKILDSNGADIIELGIPYSDPLADGPVIQAAATRALQNGTKLESVLEMLKVTTPSLQAPIVLFTYYNSILHRGIDNFLEQVAAAGVAGLVVPDLPLEEAAGLLKPATERGIDLILLIAPTSSSERIEAIARSSQGFIYLVSVTGVTGMRSQVEGRVLDLLQKVRQVTDKPLGVGFGISQPAQATQVRDWGADAAIVGSAFVQRLATGTPAEGLSAIAEFCQSLKAAIKTS
ncbi:tryptophan synthase, alpha chain [Trichormus variabilis ATCC 29413]|uniref:Tryptophan synthase alpha chain n=2 Tax=Anabaena variabilis TaxID=264691 RepID=TRPA_TRIV2|nr:MULTISPECIES: tryptophan synthase subunit alpha [Nostocaceae]Q3MBD2.1 RecName: Full=Tryptophan synthase alpha chain [Trichormus variabilis ATCC 29413]ABA21704.1 tryptophan synthase, alpha chain [Trichormus variabilis ATCC 29413]MBC1213053.1 tryptophan synthase subunit alpha [Trichormus variabilis ARAD]MBC1255182.1 tryptophan synthase subunit alpha [Trichormus variabilis V5]MBC1267619.1 tryptophan synthase subunit alpha [Trichormus variabilis FSR]MBC1303667.1 tryptophan synthase subunit alp